MSTDERWEPVASLDDLPSGGLLLSMVGDEEIVLCRIGDAVFALHNWCTHGDARLSEGRLDGYELQCPLHEGRFDVRSGQVRCAPATADARVYAVRVVGTVIEAKPEEGSR